MHILSILKMAALLSSAAISSSVSAATCDGPVEGKICLADCKGKGFQVKAPQLISSIELGPTFQLDFDENGKPFASSKGVKVGLTLPDALRAVDLNFNAATARIQVGAAGGVPVGLLQITDFVKAAGSSVQGNVELDMDRVNFTALDEGGFKQLFRAITLANGTIPLELKGHAGNKATVRNTDQKGPQSDDPEVCLDYVTFTAPSKLTGLGGLREATITELPKIVGGNPATGLELAIKLKVVNPSNVILHLGSDVVLDLVYSGQKIGTVILPKMNLEIGDNIYDAKSFVFPDKTNIPALLATKELMSKFTGKTPAEVIVNNGRAAKAPVLDAALGSLSIPQTLPANKEDLIKSAIASISSLNYTSNADTAFEMSAAIDAYNPFDAPVSITAIKSTLSYKGKDCLTSNTKISGFTIPPKGTTVSPGFGVRLDGSVDPVLCGSELVTGTLTNQEVKVDVKSTLSLDIGGYPSAIDYNQKDVSIKSIATPCGGPKDQAYCISDCSNDGAQIGMPIPLIKDITLPNFRLEFDPANNPNVPKATSKGVKVGLDVPGWLGYINMEFSGTGSSISVGQPGGPLVAKIDTPDYEPSSGSINEKAVTLNIEKKDMVSLFPTGLDRLLALITAYPGPVPIRMKGSANNKAKFPKPFDKDVCLRYIGFDVTSTSLSGLGGLKNTSITALPKILAGNPDTGIKLEVPLVINNPSTVTLDTKTDITLGLTFENQTIGTVILPNFKLEAGSNAVVATSFIHPDPTNIPQRLATKKLFSQFTGGVASNIVVGNGKAAGLPVLDLALASLSIPQVLPANTDKLIVDSVADISSLSYAAVASSSIDLSTKINAFNPFDVPVTILNIKSTLAYKGKDCITTNANVAFPIAPKATAASPDFKATLDGKVDPSLCGKEFVTGTLLGQNLKVEAKSTLTLKIGDYLSQIDYNQPDVVVKRTATPCPGSTEGAYCISDCSNDGAKIGMPFPLINAITLPNFKLEFDPASPNPDVPKASSTDVKVGLDVPDWLGYIDMVFSGTGSSISVGQPGGPLVAKIDTPDYEPSSGSIGAKAVNLNIVQKDMVSLFPTGLDRLLALITAYPGPVPIRLKGSANNKAKFPPPFAATVCLRYINFDVTSTSLSGLGGLTNTTITGVAKLVSGNPIEGIKLQVPILINNPSTVSIVTKTDITLDLNFEGLKLGTVVLPNFSLSPGQNALVGTGFVHPDSTNVPQLLATKKLFSQFTGGVVSDISVSKGKAAGLKVLDLALGALNIPTKLPPNTETLIKSATSRAWTINIPATRPDGTTNFPPLYSTLESTLQASNPFDVPVVIVKVVGTLFYKDKPCVTINSDVSGFVIGPKQTVTSPPIRIALDQTVDDLCKEFFTQQITLQTSILRAQTTLSLAIDKYPAQIDYVQDGIPVNTKLLPF
ncbi:hypothetical protein HDU97_000785 [Phlyctochytrium planicorne]|nr:hypothetical protein HDU97_000785 [Phlyctochytrium planicorne]